MLLAFQRIGNSCQILSAGKKQTRRIPLPRQARAGVSKHSSVHSMSLTWQHQQLENWRFDMIECWMHPSMQTTFHLLSFCKHLLCPSNQYSLQVAKRPRQCELQVTQLPSTLAPHLQAAGEGQEMSESPCDRIRDECFLQAFSARPVQATAFDFNEGLAAGESQEQCIRSLRLKRRTYVHTYIDTYIQIYLYKYIYIYERGSFRVYLTPPFDYSY